ncbi:2Fe-2S iron-sulfur cluster-binding protein, partial [Pseudomonas sp. HMSC076A11]|uniref:2Fe-2S iron-sulfur cluster-binding protein n=1 Tax=Pseudomonas sp. HMSC076A11 TaxID=1715195 RepID=UPI0021141CC1
MGARHRQGRSGDTAHRRALVEPRDRLMRIVLQPSGACLELLPGERILDGARRLGYDCPQSCRNGNCHICAALLVEGR